MNLKDTAELMCSASYVDRFKAEYIQLKTRYNRLQGMLEKLKAGTLEFTTKSPSFVLDMQAEAMHGYLNALEIRANVEGIDLSD